MLVKRCLEVILQPLFIITVVWLVLAIYLFWQNKKNYLYFIMLIMASSLLFLSLGILPGYLIKQLERQYPVVTQVDKTVPWIVVLTGGQLHLHEVPSSMQISADSLKRLIEAIRLSDYTNDSKILISGGNKNPISESKNLSNLAYLLKIQSQRIYIEEQSKNTEDQAIQIKKILQQQSFYLVTSALHMSRAMMIFKKQGLNPIPAPTAFHELYNQLPWYQIYLPNSKNLFYLSCALHEYYGIIYLKFKWLI